MTPETAPSAGPGFQHPCERIDQSREYSRCPPPSAPIISLSYLDTLALIGDPQNGAMRCAPIPMSEAGPSEPAKSKKARKQAALEELLAPVRTSAGHFSTRRSGKSSVGLASARASAQLKAG
ncbi:hypothetical protein V502_00169 [Pseudogymnoascus sp. VKM F-4520 (FW-2644)]|nr:hypothetical protein V502_00169 [Pseudogymnoascus sp. VKM F-4520 (FW-2644)]